MSACRFFVAWASACEYLTDLLLPVLVIISLQFAERRLVLHWRGMIHIHVLSQAMRAPAFYLYAVY